MRIRVMFTSSKGQGSAIPGVSLGSSVVLVKEVLRYWHAALLGIAVLLLILSVVTALLTGKRMVQRVNWVNNTHETISLLSDSVLSIRDAETEQRAFVATRVSAYRESFEQLIGKIRKDVELLKKSMAGNSLQLERARQLERLLESRINRLEATSRLRDEVGIEQALAHIEDGPGLKELTDINTLKRVMQTEETGLLGRRQADMRSEFWMAAATILLSAGMALVLAINAFAIMRRAFAALKREADLLRAKEQAEQADREKSEFLANMSHEIRTPMNAVLGFTELLRGIITTPKQRQYVDAINASGKTLLSLINDILDLSKIEAGRLDIVFKPTSVRSVLHGVKAMFAQQAEERGLKLDVSVDPSVPSAVMFDGVRLRQIFINVVGNALKFTSQGSVTVRAWSKLAEDDETTVALHFSVADTGVGITPEDHETIFEPFRQVGKRDRIMRDGTGLGLSITRRLTELLNGRIGLESAIGRGSTFFFEFPRVTISAALPDEERVATPDEDLDQLRPSLILVADDVPLNRELVAGYFEGTRHRVLLATGGLEAVEMAEKFHPDVILMDIRMPDMDGNEARRMIRQRQTGPAVQMIALTASTMIGDEEALRSEFDGYIRKPFTRAMLHAELARVLPVGGELETAPLPVVDEYSPVVEPARWRQFLERLDQIHRDVWPLLSRSMGLMETAAFARELVKEAGAVQCSPVLTYAHRLLAEVQAIDIRAQEKTMKEFPQLVAQIARTVERLTP